MLYCTSVILISMLISGSFEKGNFLPYAEFVSKVREGKIKKVKMGDYTDLYGYYNIDDEENPLCTDYEISNDVLLMDLLKSNNVIIAPMKKDEFKDPMMPFYAIPFLIPFINLILIGFLIWKNACLNKQILEILEKKDKA
jgi:ATP-dependent Zn protease